MSSHGSAETAQLKANVEAQLSRLLAQLSDLDELRGELEDEEYEETRRDTMEQLAEFDATLKRMLDGDMTLVSSLGQLKLAAAAAVAQAFKTPEVIALFAAKEPAALRARLTRLAEDARLGRLAPPAHRAQSMEIVLALKKLGETLLPEEAAALASASADQKAKFEAADRAIAEAAVLSMARR